MSSRERLHQPAHTGELLQQLVQTWGFAEKLRQHQTWQIWDAVVGPQIAARARPIRIRNGVLEVRVDQPVWMQQLQLLKPKILANLNNKLGGDLLLDLFLRQGAHQPEQRPVPPRPPAELPPLPAAELARIDRIVAPLQDPELRQRLGQLLRKQAQLELLRRQQE